uniref:F-box/LRR-repeat protein 6 n=1 Tax=Aceria tosichella TaxID=561515 RepID=A0A6G1SP67_9ACAR
MRARSAYRQIPMVRRQRTYEAHERLKRKNSTKTSNTNKRNDTNPQLALILKVSPHYERKIHIPYELMIKIFHDVIQASDHPIKDLCNLASVCEAWRLIILQSPSLWSRINFNELPLTDGNLKVLKTLFDKLPAILNHVQEVTLGGPMNFKTTESVDFLERILNAPNLEELTLNKLDPQCKASMMGQMVRAISRSNRLKRLSIKNNRHFFANQRWIVDFLLDNGEHLEELHLTSSLRAVTPQLIRALATDFCPSLRVLDLSTCDFLCNHTFDAVALSQTMPNLAILRVANVSFRRVPSPPEILTMTKLEELSMPISMRDADRDDALFTTLAFGSDRVTSLDLRGSSISAYALMNMPSSNIRELHIDDLCPQTRSRYGSFVAKWQHSLEVVSLVKINCSETIKSCLKALVGRNGVSKIRELDLESSDVTEDDLRWFLSTASSLRMINLSSCRSLPRGCKGCYMSGIHTGYNQSLDCLKRRLKAIETHSDSETEIDEDNSSDSMNSSSLPRKRRRYTRQRPDYVY